tara:strand:- start:13 stop:477 length:465 start_codon:yes stop_codon:yes gene_type:complete
MKTANFGDYMIYENGNVYSFKTNKFLKHSVKQYVSVDLYFNNKPRTYLIHRLIAENFIPNIQNKPFVNHIDGNKHNYKIENLEWVSAKENTLHAWRIGLCKAHNLGKRVICENSGKIYETAKEAAMELGYNHRTLCNMLNTNYIQKNKTKLKYI